MKNKTIYIANDWVEFDTEYDCIKYEKENSIKLLPEKIKHKTYIHCEKWEVYNELLGKGYVFPDSISQNLAYILNEIEVELEIDTKTWKVINISLIK